MDKLRNKNFTYFMYNLILTNKFIYLFHFLFLK